MTNPVQAGERAGKGGVNYRTSKGPRGRRRHLCAAHRRRTGVRGAGPDPHHRSPTSSIWPRLTRSTSSARTTWPGGDGPTFLRTAAQGDGRHEPGRYRDARCAARSTWSRSGPGRDPGPRDHVLRTDRDPVQATATSRPASRPAPGGHHRAPAHRVDDDRLGSGPLCGTYRERVEDLSRASGPERRSRRPPPRPAVEGGRPYRGSAAVWRRPGSHPGKRRPEHESQASGGRKAAAVAEGARTEADAAGRGPVRDEQSQLAALATEEEFPGGRSRPATNWKRPCAGPVIRAPRPSPEHLRKRSSLRAAGRPK